MVKVLFGCAACLYIVTKFTAGVVAILERHVTRVVIVKFRPLEALAKQCLSHWRVEPRLLIALGLFAQAVRELLLQELCIVLKLLGHCCGFCFIDGLISKGYLPRQCQVRQHQNAQRGRGD